MVKGGVNYRLVTDSLGSVRLVLNASTSAVAERMDYDEFGVVMNDTSPGFQPYVPLGGITRVAAVAVGATAVLTVVVRVLDVAWAHHALPAVSMLVLLWGFGPFVLLAANVITIAIFLRWVAVATRNVAALSAPETRAPSTAWAVASFLIPFVNLVAPLSTMKLLSRESGCSTRAAWLPTAWWITWWTWLLSWFFTPGQVESREDASFNLARTVFCLAAAALCTVLVRNIARGQERRATLTGIRHVHESSR